MGKPGWTMQKENRKAIRKAKRFSTTIISRLRSVIPAIGTVSKYMTADMHRGPTDCPI